MSKKLPPACSHSRQWPVDITKLFSRHEARRRRESARCSAAAGDIRSQAQVRADEVVDASENELFQDRRLVNQRKLTLAMVRNFGDFGIHAKVDQVQPGVHEVRLPLELAAAEVGHEAHAVDEVDAEQLDLLPLPVAELAAGEVGVVEDGVKAGRFTIVGSKSAYARNEVTSATTEDAIEIRLQRGAAISGRVLRAAGDRIERVPADDVVAGLADVDPVDVPFTGEAQIVGRTLCWAKTPGWIGSDQKLLRSNLKLGPSSL
jgi:hypothetical protein